VLEDELEADLSLLLSLLLSPLFLWCLPLWLLFFDESDVDDDEEEAAGVEEAGAGVDCAKAGPAISASAITGMSFLNIDVVSRGRMFGCGASAKRRYYDCIVPLQTSYDRNVMLVSRCT
jgi:hypothetical protein